MEKNYKYLLRIYSLVDEYLAGTSTDPENLPEIIISFCVVTEKIFKIQLYRRNPILVYENVKIKDNSLFKYNKWSGARY